MRPLLALALLSAPALAGCVAPAAPPEPVGATAAWPRGEHPWPLGDGSEWPPGLAGPFALAEVLPQRVPVVGGVEMDGYVYLPELPDGVRAPVVLWTNPYFGQAYPDADSEAIRDGWSVPVNLLVEQGYAVGLFNVRGSGRSGGCFEMFGPTEAEDQALLVEWAAAQPWSNGRVGFVGLSYHGTTPWMAAIHNPPALKTVVVAGMVSDLYTFYHSPQGAAFDGGAAFQAYFNALTTLTPPVFGSAQGTLFGGEPARPERWTVEFAPHAAERACPEVVRTMGSLAVGERSDVRDQPFWDARRLIDRFPDVTAAVFLTHGFQDAWGSGHQSQENAAWAALLQAPKRQLEGQWAHSFPDENDVHPDWAMEDWNERLLAWLDFWLKGLGDAAPGLGDVDYQDGSGAWRASRAWPPPEARAEVVHLAGDALAPRPGGEARAFLAAPVEQKLLVESAPEVREEAFDLLCPDAPLDAAVPRSLLYLSEPLAAPVVVAGNPLAYLTLVSDRPGGLVSVYLFDLAPDFACEAGTPRGARALSLGAADLRFHAGNFQGRDFPTGAPTAVRVDLVNLAERIEPGHRIAAAVGWGALGYRTAQPYSPRIEVQAGEEGLSHIVLPLVEGTLGGAAPTLAYPPRPFVPVQP